MQTKRRFGVLALILGSAVINHIDRTNISVVAGAMSQELSLTPVHMEIIF